MKKWKSSRALSITKLSKGIVRLADSFVHSTQPAGGATSSRVYDSSTSMAGTVNWARWSPRSGPDVVRATSVPDMSRTTNSIVPSGVTLAKASSSASYSPLQPGQSAVPPPATST